ncbi:MAG: hypothetical protein HC904_14670 [Blastochloris sp.]|nr:hypothetical protein [Blastochloris sp.]
MKIKRLLVDEFGEFLGGKGIFEVSPAMAGRKRWKVLPSPKLDSTVTVP